MTRRWSPQSRRLRKRRNFCCWVPRKTSDSCPRGASCLRKGPGRALSGSPVPRRRRRSKVRTHRWAAPDEQSYLQHGKSTNLSFIRCVHAIRALLTWIHWRKTRLDALSFTPSCWLTRFLLSQLFKSRKFSPFEAKIQQYVYMVMTDDLGLLLIHSFILLHLIRKTRM